jgi:hypothetical protein
MRRINAMEEKDLFEIEARMGRYPLEARTSSRHNS